MSKDLLYQIALTKIDHIGPVLSKTLVSYCGGVEAIFRERYKALVKVPGIGESLARSIVNSDPKALSMQELKFILENKIQSYFYLDQSYPQRLKHFEDSPILLFYKGTIPLNHHRTVAIVGTRKPTDHGKVICEMLVDELLHYDVLIISGLAYGIDVCAHRRCISLNMPTLGILGHGLDRIYPSQHASVAKKMIACGGLLTEFGQGTKPDREHFPMRNRIIAALSDAVVVIESKTSGGSIITADFANAYNKDVFAFPGRVSDEVSSGCNALIKKHRAQLIESADDLAYILRWKELDAKKEIQTQLFQELSHSEKQVLNLLKHNGQMGIDVINSYMKLASSELAALLLNLEFKGAIKSIPGKRFMVV